MEPSITLTRVFRTVATSTMLCWIAMASGQVYAATSSTSQSDGASPTSKAGVPSSAHSSQSSMRAGKQTSGSSASGSSTGGAGEAGRMDPRSLSGGAATTAGNGAGGSGADQ